jgi:DNA-binding transcriptional regulator YdaS (Cro superfamily)
VSPAPPFTDKQGQYLAFIYAYSRIFRQPPAEADMQRHFQVSPPSVHQMVLTLERAGLIRRTAGVARSIEILVEPENLPVLRWTSNRQNLCATDGILDVGRSNLRDRKGKEFVNLVKLAVFVLHPLLVSIRYLKPRALRRLTA